MRAFDLLLIEKCLLSTDKVSLIAKLIAKCLIMQPWYY